MEMAECYLWRAEVEEMHFYAILNVLEALGYLDEATVAMIMDDMTAIYPSYDEKDDKECKWQLEEKTSTYYCIRGHGCENARPDPIPTPQGVLL